MHYPNNLDPSSTSLSLTPQSTSTEEAFLTTKTPPVITSSVEHSISASQTSPTLEPSSGPENSSPSVVIAGVVLAGVIVMFVLLSGGVSACCITRARKCSRKQDLYLSEVLGGVDNSGFLLGAPEEGKLTLLYRGSACIRVMMCTRIASLHDECDIYHL